MIEEIVIRGQKFRGILCCPSAKTPWKISVSFKFGSWKTYGKYPNLLAAMAAWHELKERERLEKSS